jgi:hypothetical protein
VKFEERSTNVPIADRFLAPMIRSPSQLPGTARSEAIGGRSAMLTMFGIRFLRCPTFRDGRRTARPVRRQRVSSCLSAPRDCTYRDW